MEGKVESRFQHCEDSVGGRLAGAPRVCGWSVAVRLQRTPLGWVASLLCQRFKRSVVSLSTWIERLFLGLDFGEIVGDCILDGVGARAFMLGENPFSLRKTILGVSSRKMRQWRLPTVRPQADHRLTTETP